MESYSRELIDVGNLVFSFAQVNRGTLHPDGIRPESDTDHTVMLSVSACAIADRFYKNLDLGLIAQFAIVHDLVEAYAGDTDTFNISDADRAKKEEREHVALERISSEFERGYSWIPATIKRYEEQKDQEAKLVKAVDKLMTKLTHLINGGAAFKKRAATKDDLIHQFTDQLTVCEEKYGKDFPEVVAMLRYLTDRILQEAYV